VSALSFYLGCLAFGGLFVGASLLGGHHGDSGGHDGPDDLADHPGPSPVLLPLVSLRFWTFSLAFFGLAGAALTSLGALAAPLLPVVAGGVDLTNMPIEVSVKSAYSKGGIPLNVHGIANIKIAGEQPVLDNAVERFLGVSRDRIMSVAKETLEGNLRGVLAALTPEEVNEDKIKFAQSLLSEAEDDLRRIGLELDTLKIQDVSDDVGYLDSIGRRQSAEVQKRALIAEAGSKAESAIRSASNRKETEISRLEAQLGALRADNARRVTDAQTRGAAVIAEARGQVTSQLARAEAELEVQRARIEQVRRQLAADVLEPARAARAAAEAAAKGKASQIVEQGRATGEALEQIAASGRRAGAAARQVFVLQKVDELVRIVMGTVGDLRVRKLTALSGLGAGNGAAGSDLTARLIAAGAQLKAATGVDLLRAIEQRVETAAVGAPGALGGKRG
jgi:flotillin